MLPTPPSIGIYSKSKEPSQTPNRRQFEYYSRNTQNASASGGQQTTGQASRDNCPDQDTAERQVDLVQKAQRLTERRITPLRLNLLRGRHYVFAQASQMEAQIHDRKI